MIDAIGAAVHASICVGQMTGCVDHVRAATSNVVVARADRRLKQGVGLPLSTAAPDGRGHRGLPTASGMENAQSLSTTVEH
jgi:hypothetical protein